MAQEIINLKHSAIASAPTGANGEAWISINSRTDRGSTAYIYFSTGAVKKFGLQPGRSITFINDIEGCYFYCSDSEDGFVLRIQNKDRGGLVIQNYSLVKYLMGKYPNSIRQMLPDTRYCAFDLCSFACHLRKK